MFLVALLASAALAAGVGTPAPPIGSPDLAGAPVELGSLEAELVLVDFWATWCTPCTASLPFYEALQKTVPKGQLAIIAVSVDEERGAVDAFVKHHKLSLRVVHDAKGAVAERYDPPTMPTAYLIDRKRQIRAVYVGFNEDDKKTIAADITRLLGEAK